MSRAPKVAAQTELPEPKRGRNEMQSVLGEEMTEEDELRIPIAAAFARLKKIKTFYFFLCALGALGLAFVTAPYRMAEEVQHFLLGESP